MRELEQQERRTNIVERVIVSLHDFRTAFAIAPRLLVEAAAGVSGDVFIVMSDGGEPVRLSPLPFRALVSVWATDDVGDAILARLVIVAILQGLDYDDASSFDWTYCFEGDYEHALQLARF